ncbi:MAG: glycosyltransferase family 1 protein [Archangiaceae bacterium]|nr:glycosyltransferase family 1 protein [Archangiaceae bacterium]
MKVSILAPGSRGDIQPYIALGQGLVAAGHGVRVVTTIDHEALVKGYGLEVTSIPVSVEAALRARETSAAVEGGGVIASFRAFAELAKKAARATAELGLEASLGVDAVVTGFSAAALADGIARKLQVPLVQAYNVPLTPTAAYPGALLPGLDFGGLSRRLGHRLTRQALWMTARSSANEVLREVLDARPMGVVPPDVSGLCDGPVLYGFSEAFLPRGPEWKGDVEVTGFWFVEESSAFAPPPALEAFLEAGPPPVCIGFGSMTSEDPKTTTGLVLEAVKQAGVRCALLSGWAGLAPESLPPTVFLTKSIAHSWLYPRCSAVVHHGGAGTTAAALRAGVPAIVVPFHGDQPFWASRVQASGTGPAPIPKKQLSVKTLAAALAQATTDEAMKARCAALGARVRAEAGVARAVERIAAVSRVS